MLCALLMLTRPGKGTGTLCIQLTNVQISIKISHFKKKKKKKKKKKEVKKMAFFWTSEGGNSFGEYF